MLDLVVIGAGLYGIQMARTYLEMHPRAKLTILEEDDEVGGVWGRKRIYSTFITQTPLSMAQFSDQQLRIPEAERRQQHPFCHARHVAEYIEAYVRSHKYDTESLYDRIRFKTRAVKVVRSEANAQLTWTIKCLQREARDRQSDDVDEPQCFKISSRKLVVCTGLASQPVIPSIEGASRFAGLAIHSKDFASYEPQILNLAPSSSHSRSKGMEVKGRRVTVVGGGKSAADIIYACASAPDPPKSISWVIRPDGNGPAALLPSNGAENFYTRLVAAFLPFVPQKGEAQSWLEIALYQTKFGQWVMKKVWDRADRKYRASASFDREEGRENDFRGLESETPVFWQNDSSGINQHQDFWGLVARRVKIYRHHIVRIEEDHLSLEHSSYTLDEQKVSVPTDILVYCTGWAPRSDLFDQDLASQLGLPIPLSEKTPHDWQQHDARSNADLIKRFPILANPPRYRRQSSSLASSRLYKTMAPVTDLQDRSLLFLGALVVGNNFLVAEVQALWAVAWLDGHIKSSVEDMQHEIAMTVAWNRRRYLNKGQLGTWFFFDVVKYADTLLDQLGLKGHLSSWWLIRLFSPLRPSDLQGLCKEYKSLYEPDSEVSAPRTDPP